MMVCQISWTDCPSKVRAPITVRPISIRINPYSVLAWPALRLLTRFIVGVNRRPRICLMARFPTTGSGGGLLRNPYPALADASRDRLQFRMHVQLRQGVRDLGADRVG